MRRKAFRCSDSMSSVTKNMMFDYCEFEDYIIKVVDGPGVGDTDLSEEKGLQNMVDEMSRAIMSSTEGYHAILIVVRYGQRFTKDDVKSLQILKSIFGESFIRDHAILVMTWGDIFSQQRKDTEVAFQEWCDEQDEANFKALLSEVGHRVVLFDNMTKDENKQSEQIRQLLAIIEDLSVSGKRYTNERFDHARKSRDHALASSAKPQLHEAALREQALIMQEFQNVDFTKPASELKRLGELKTRAQNLKRSIKEQDKGTGALATFIKKAEKMENLISEEIKALLEDPEVGQKKKGERGYTPTKKM